ncbi:2-oxoacid:ferredoxin oxidoreductase subunit beta [bacterium]|nr:2-oxoacid:ferredoxin oxidoreductase subunit beta [bacterium]
MSQAIEVARTYLKPHKKLPTVWCGGCGLGVILSSLLRVVSKMGLEKNDLATISGIGCTGRMPTYVDSNTLHTTHGRALAFATGVKLANPKLNVIVTMGDGDALAIGGNHFIHACRRNIDITAIVANNFIYGMTGGQYSPTTPHGKRGTTAPYGNVEYAFDASVLAAGAGASFVARTSVYHVRELDKLLEQAITHKGFSVVEVVSNCYTSYGRLNKYKSPVDMFRWMKDNSVSVERAREMSPEELEGKFTRGVFVQEDKREFIEVYDSLAERLTSDSAMVNTKLRETIERYERLGDRLKTRAG